MLILRRSLDDFIASRLGRETRHIHVHPISSYFTDESDIEPLEEPPPRRDASPRKDTDDLHSREARIRAFRELQRASPEERHRINSRMAGPSGSDQKYQTWTPIHLLSAEEVKSLFRDIAIGLGFLVRILPPQLLPSY